MSQMSKPLTVGELKKLLQPYSDEALVYAEGCDCTGVAAGLEAYGNVTTLHDDVDAPIGTQRVLLTRVIGRRGRIRSGDEGEYAI